MPTGQHKQMLYQVCDTFGIKPDYDLEIMKERQDLFDITTEMRDTTERPEGEKSCIFDNSEQYIL